MSLTPFQNSDSIKQALYEELQNILNGSTEVRQAAEEHIKQLEFTEGMSYNTTSNRKNVIYLVKY